MDEESYHQLAKVLDTLPNGFPATESGVEIRLLRKIFAPEQADLFCDLRLTYETPEQIAERTGRPLEGLEEALVTMAERGQCSELRLGETRLFKMLPWILGIYEYQVGHMDRELAELSEEYNPIFGKQFFAQTPQLMQTISVEETIPNPQESLPYEKVSHIIENGQSFRVVECICKKEKALLEDPCDRPVEVCLAVAPMPGYFEQFSQGRILSQEEAYELLDDCEEKGLVHLASNVQTDQHYICNCCKCCCGVLSGINRLGIPASLVVNSHYYAVQDEALCTQCGICADERCQVGAIALEDGQYRVAAERCIGCGLCVSACPSEAMSLARKEEENLTPPPENGKDWFEKRGRERGVDFGTYK